MDYYDSVAAGLAKRAGRTTSADFDDYFQEARLAALIAVAEHDPNRGAGNEAAFVIERMRWRVTDAQRRAIGRHHQHAKPGLDVDIPDPRDPQAEADNRLSAHADLRRVASMVGRLPWLEAITITLHYFEGLTHKAIGAKLGFTESRSCQICRRATAHLQRLLAT